MYKFELQGYSAEKEICEKLEEQAHDQSIVLLENIMQKPLISEIEEVLGKSSYQLVDLIADYMEFSFPKVFVVPSFGKPLAHSSKYKLLHTFQSFLVFSSVHKDMSSNQLLESSFRKFVYT